MKPILTVSATAGPAIAEASAIPASNVRFLMLHLPVGSIRSGAIVSIRRLAGGLGFRADDHRDQLLPVRTIGLEFSDLAALTQHHRAVREFDDMFHVMR